MTPRNGRSSRVAGIVAVSLCALAPVEARDAGSVRALIEEGDYSRAESRAREVLAGVDACSPARPELEALLGEALRRGRRTAEETLALAEHALELAEELFGADDPRTAEPRLQLGLLRSVRRDWEGGKRDLQRAFDTMREASWGKDPRQALALTNLAYAGYKIDGDPERALAMLDEAEAVLDRTMPGESLDRAWVFNMRGNVHFALGRYAAAREAYGRSLEIRRRRQRADHPVLANTLSSLGSVQYAEGRLAEARASFEEGVAIREGDPEAAWILADARARLGEIHLALDDARRARACYEAALRDLEGIGDRETSAYARLQLDLALIASQEGRPSESRDLVEEALATLERAPDAQSAIRVHAKLQIASLAIQSRDPDLASRAIEEARTVDAGSDLRDYADELEAWVCYLRGDVARAESLFAEVAGRKSLGLPQVLRNLACVRLERKDLAGALESSLAAERRYREEWEIAVIGLDELSAIGLEGSAFVRSTLHPAIFAATRLGDPAAIEPVWNALIASQDRVFREFAQRAELVRAASSAELEAVGRRLAEARTRLASLHVRRRREGTDAALDAAIAAAREERERAESELARRIEGEGRAARRAPDLDAVRGALEPGTALVRYCRVQRPPPADAPDRDPLAWESTYCAFLLAEGGKEARAVDLGLADEVDDLTRRLRLAIRSGLPTSSYGPIASALRRRVLDPVLAAAPGARFVLVVPAGSLAFVPFHALCDEAGKFLAETGPMFQALASESDLLPTGSASGSGLLALGDPAGVEGWRPLPEARVEIAAVARFFADASREEESVVLLEGERATEWDLRRSARGRRVVHLAAHGYFEGEASGASAASRGVSPGLAEIGPRDDSSLATSQPFLRSGLVLAPSGDPEALPGEADGVLTAEEVASLDLSGVEWVVLSACDSGLGELRATEGVLGLGRAFRTAGARTVIASLWPVDDRRAREWMEALYRSRFEKGLSTPESVRAASLEMLATLRAAKEEPLPLHWASFVALGGAR